MLSRISRQVRYLRYLQSLQTKPTLKQLASLKQSLSSEYVQYQMINPFLLSSLPNISKEQLPSVIMFAVKQMDEVNFRNLNLSYFVEFVKNYSIQLIDLLSQKELCLQLFCLTILRYFQEFAKVGQLYSLAGQLKLFPIIDLIADLLDAKTSLTNSKTLTTSGINKQKPNRILIQTLLIAVSIQYVRLIKQQQLRSQKYIERAVRCSCLLIQLAQTQNQFQVVRELLAITSHLFVFNGSKLRPINFLQFSLGDHQGLELVQDFSTQNVQYRVHSKYIDSLRAYIKLDMLYQKQLVKMLRNLLSLQINSSMLVNHFQVLVLLIREKIMPHLKKIAYDILIETETKKNSSTIDQIFKLLLNTDNEVLQEDSQRFNMILAEAGDSKRKSSFVDAYFTHYKRGCKKLLPQIINFMFQIFMDQQISLEDVKGLVINQAVYIDSNNICKLHQNIAKASESDQVELLQILYLILQSRKQKAFKSSNEYISCHPFLKQQWLYGASGCVQVFRTYLKLIVETICDRSLQISPALINMNSYVVKIQGDFLTRGQEYYEIILKNAQNTHMFDETMFRYMIICQTVFGDKLPISSFSYFSKNFIKITEKQGEFLTFLQYLVTLLKNKSAVLIYLQAILSLASTYSEYFNRTKLYQLSFLTRLVQQNLYFKINSFSIQSVVILYELSLLIKDQTFLIDVVSMIKSWSSLMNRSQCKSICYFFCFREIKKLYPFIKENQKADPRVRLDRCWNIIIQMLDEDSQQCEYIHSANNLITIDFKKQDKLKKGVKMEGNLMRNNNKTLIWHILITTNLKEHEIIVNNDRIIQLSRLSQNNGKEQKNRDQKVKEIPIKELKKNPQNVKFFLKVQSNSKQKTLITFSLMGLNNMEPYSIDGSVKSIRLFCKSKAFLHNISVADLISNDQINPITSHIHNLNRWQVTTTSIAKLSQRKFIDKFDFEHAFCQLGEMLHHFRKCNITYAYQLFVKLSIRMIKHQQKSNQIVILSSQVKTMNTIFNLLKTALAKNKQQLQFRPEVKLESVQNYAGYYYHLFASALLPTAFWHNFTKQSKNSIFKIFKQCLTVTAFKSLENKSMQLFECICNIMTDHFQQNQQFSQLADLISTIIKTHQFNSMLQLKFQHYLMLAQKYYFIEGRVQTLLADMTQYLNVLNQKFQQEQALCKMLVIQSSCFEIAFSMSPIRAKIAILHYFAHNSIANRGNTNFPHRIKELMEMTVQQQRQQVMFWLMTELKQLILMRKAKLNSISLNSEQSCVCSNIQLYLNMIVSHLKEVGQQCKQNGADVVVELLKCMKDSLKGRKRLVFQIQRFLCSQEYILFLQEIIQIVVFAKTGNQVEINIFQYSMELITKFSKIGLLHFLVNFRRQAFVNVAILVFPLQYQGFRALTTYGFSMMLQYTYQILVYAQQSLNISYQQKDILIQRCITYFQFVFNNLQSLTTLPNPLLYTYPKLLGEKDPQSSEDKIKLRLRHAQKQAVVELKGGIYFKLIIILMQIINHCPFNNYSHFLEPLILAVFKQTSGRGMSKIFGDFRGPLEIQLGQSYIVHQQYFQREQEPRSVIDSDFDLTPFLTDFFLMRLADFMQQKFDMLNLQALTEYSQIFRRVLEIHPKINKDICETSIYSDCRIIQYKDIVTLKAEVSVSKLNRLYSQSPNINATLMSPKVSAKEPLSLENLDFTSAEKTFAASPKKRNRKRSTDFTFELKKRQQLFDQIKNDPNKWVKCREINLSNQFCDKAKEIRFIELLHCHFVRGTGQIQLKLSVTKSQHLERTRKKHFQTLKCQQLKYLQRCTSVEENVKRVRKIYPYTIPTQSVMKITEHCLSNMTCPITQHVQVKQYKTKRLKDKQSFNLHYFQNQINAFQNLLLTQRQLKNSVQSQEEAIIEEEDVIVPGNQYCEWVTRQGVYFCEWQYIDQGLKLKCKDDRYDPNSKQSKDDKKLDPMWYLLLGAPTSNLLKPSGSNPLQFFIYYDDVDQVLFRKFNQISNNSLQFFLKNGTSKFISFYTKKFLAVFVKLLQKKRKNLRIIRDPIKQFQKLGYTQKWMDGLLSNFDYLMLVNKYAGRTYNDLNQYYVFPWVLNDYTSPKLDLSDPEIYRDLSKPMGAINPNKLRRYKDKYKNEFHDLKCLYGSHYSTSLFVLYYLVRLEPFSTLHREMQKGDFDVADRIFNSIAQVWQNLIAESATSDIKEAIPEFYYMPSFLKNIGLIEFGSKQCGEEVSDVQLPPWASSAQQFIMTMRAALESDHVSEQLHLWIDLIFERVNIFHPYSYTDPVDFQELAKKNMHQLEAVICQISYFGQCPLQIFRKQHKPKKPAETRRVTRSYLHIKLLASSSSTHSQTPQQAFLSNQWNFCKICIQNNFFIIDVENKTKKTKGGIIIELDDDHQKIQESLQNPRQLNKRCEPIKLLETVLQTNRAQLRMGRQIVLQLGIPFQYTRIEANDIWIVFYGLQGLRVYNWQLQMSWNWEKEEVRDVYLQPTRIIFCNPSGKVFIFSFFDRRYFEIMVFSDSSDMRMRVIALPRLPARDNKNQTNYKILCVGDGRRVTMISHSCEEMLNKSSII